MTGSTVGSMVELQLEVAQFLAREARLLDEERYEAWLELFTEDTHYWVPGIENRSRRDLRDRPATADTDHAAYFDDTLESLRQRVLRFTAPTAWAEDPPTRHLHVVSNIEVDTTARPDEILVRSVFVNYRGQGEADQATLYGRREDLLRRGDDGRLRIARRHVTLRHNILPAKNINTFF